jgi:hypothetical protein
MIAVQHQTLKVLEVMNGVPCPERSNLSIDIFDQGDEAPFCHR